MEATEVIGTRLDYWVIIGYFVLIFSFGFYFARFTRSTKDFFMAGQRFSWWLVASCLLTFSFFFRDLLFFRLLFISLGVRAVTFVEIFRRYQ